MATIKKLRVQGYRAIDESVLDLENTGTTTLVGRNDSGKSSYLNALRLLLVQDATVLAEDICRQSTTKQVRISALIDIEKEVAQRAGISDGEYWAVREFPRGEYYLVRPNNENVNRIHFKTRATIGTLLPYLLSAQGDLFSDTTARREPKRSNEIALAELYRYASPLDPHEQLEISDAAQSRISDLIQKFWPSEPPIKFRQLENTGAITYSVYDRNQKSIRLSKMGHGLQRALSLALQIEQWAGTIGADDQRIITLDEPETSLHPEAQRHFRKYIHSITNAQILITTHSASMIDASKPETVRVISRSDRGGINVLERKTTRDNFESARLALGLIPNDTLVFGYANLVVEGVTDQLVIGRWLQQLHAAGKTKLDPQSVHIINSGGDPFAQYFFIAISTSALTYALADNDTKGLSYIGNIQKKLAKESWSLPYQAFHTLLNTVKNSSLESAIPENLLLDSINAIVSPPNIISARDLVADANLTRCGNAEEFLKAQSIKFDEFKTEVIFDAASKMSIDMIPKQILDLADQIHSDIVAGISAKRPNQ